MAKENLAILDEDRICSILDCEAPATHHIETQGYDGTISFALCRNCSRSWEDDSIVNFRTDKGFSKKIPIPSGGLEDQVKVDETK